MIINGKQYFKPQDLPNRAGFRFIGLRDDGVEVKCVVVKDENMGSHYVSGGAKYCELKGWRDGYFEK